MISKSARDIVLVIFRRLRTQLLLHMGEKLPGASRFWWYAIAVVFANVRKLRVLVPAGSRLIFCSIVALVAVRGLRSRTADNEGWLLPSPMPCSLRPRNMLDLFNFAETNLLVMNFNQHQFGRSCRCHRASASRDIFHALISTRVRVLGVRKIERSVRSCLARGNIHAKPNPAPMVDLSPNYRTRPYSSSLTQRHDLSG